MSATAANTELNSAAEARALITFHGTVVHYDHGARCLRHSPIGQGDATVHAMRHGSDVILSLREQDGFRSLGAPGSDLRTVVPDDKPGVLSWVDQGQTPVASHALAALHAGGRYLRAERDGTMTFSQTSALDWERFLPIGLDDLARLEFIFANRWFSRRTGAFIESGSDLGVGRHMFQIGSGRIRIIDIVNAARDSATRSSIPRDLLLPFDGWKTERLILFRPLAYFVAFGREEIFQCAEIAIRSLFEFGQWNGDVLLLTDAGNLSFPDRLPAAMRARVRAVVMPADDVMDYILARYKFEELALAEQYQPLIYLDTDVVCDASLEEALKTVATGAELQVTPEYAMRSPGDHYGQSLLAADGIAFRPDEAGISGGIFAFRDIQEQRTLFRAVIGAACHLTALAGDRDAFGCYDQPMLNYILRKTFTASASVLGNVVVAHPNHLPPLTAPVGKGLVHFAGGVGNSTPKLAHMITYFDTLQSGRQSGG